LVILGATFLMGSSFVAGKILLERGIPPMLLVGWRFFFAALFALPLALLGKHWTAAFPRSARDAGWIAIIGLTQTAAVMGLLFYAMRTIPASTAAILLFTNPLWVATLAPFFLGERFRASSYVGLLFGIGGVALAIGFKGGGSSGSGEIVAGDWIAILSAVCWAVATIVNKRIKVELGTWAVTFWQMLVGSLAVLAIAYAEGDVWPVGLSNQEWGWFLWLAVPASTGSFGLWFAALEKGGATRCSGFLFLVPLFTILLSFLVFGHPITWTQVGGAVMVGVAISLLSRGAQSTDM
jgi:drug/metabolite transporter (DMT)-like permease